MNRIYRRIWNAARQCWVVASALSAPRGKRSQLRGLAGAPSLATCALLLAATEAIAAPVPSHCSTLEDYALSVGVGWRQEIGWAAAYDGSQRCAGCYGAEYRKRSARSFRRFHRSGRFNRAVGALCQGGEGECRGYRQLCEGQSRWGGSGAERSFQR
ncbi:hypothetical protein G6F57_020987 [Rhizopus arrhizus]|nr:hypothetical protein G6F57_020987 [Rhizopus arrhizus]